jgi:rare lipoprotein A
MKQLMLAVLALFGATALTTPGARADWRESILGNKVYDSVPMSAPRPAKSAKVVEAAKPVKSDKPAKVAKAKAPVETAAATSRKAVRAASIETTKTPASRAERVASTRTNIARPEKALAKPIYGGGSGAETGVASYYWQPQPLASGGRFDPDAMTAAHKSLPFGTRVRVTDKSTGKSVVVTINDRGPYIAGRIIDLSKRAAGELGIQGRGIASVSVVRI